MDVRAKDKKDINVQAEAFIRIYRGLQRAQHNIPFFKSNFLEGKSQYTATQLVDSVLTHIQKYPNSRTAKAWELANKYYGKCNQQNVELINEMINYAANNTRRFGIKLGPWQPRTDYCGELIKNGAYAYTVNRPDEAYYRFYIRHALTFSLAELFPNIAADYEKLKRNVM